MAKAKLASAQTTETGIVGVQSFNGRFADRYLPELQGPEGIATLATILRREPAAFAVNNAILLTARNAKWRVTPATDKPADRKAADFIETVLDDMSRTGWEAIRFALSAVAFGFSDLHIVYKRRMGRTPGGSLPPSLYNDGLVGLRKLAIRRQETIDHWITDDHGDPKFMVQRNPSDGNLLPPVPIERLLHFRGGDDRGSWEGIGWLEPAYRLYHLISNLEIIYGVGMQRAHIGLPVFAFLQKPDAETKAIVDEIARNLTVNEQQFVRYPKSVVEFDLKTVSNANSAEIRQGIAANRWELMMLGLAQFLRLGNTQSGARALANPLIVLFKDSVNGAVAEVADVLNRHLIPRLMAYNPSLLAGVTTLPQYTPSDVTQLPTQVLEFLATIQNWIGGTSADDSNWLRAMVGLPLVTEEQQLALQARTKLSSDGTPTPADAPRARRTASASKPKPLADDQAADNKGQKVDDDEEGDDSTQADVKARAPLTFRQAYNIQLAADQYARAARLLEMPYVTSSAPR